MRGVRQHQRLLLEPFQSLQTSGTPSFAAFAKGGRDKMSCAVVRACTANTSSASQKKNYRTPPLTVALGVSADCVPTRNLDRRLSVGLAHSRSNNAAGIGVLHKHKDAQFLALPCWFHLDLQILIELIARLQRTQLHELHQHGDML